MTLGLIMYFYYGITHSLLENPSEEIELTVDQSYLQAQPKSNKDNHYNYHTQEQTAVWDRHGYENRMAEDSWSTANNYNANTWDLNDLNQAWEAPATASVPPVIPSAPPTRPPIRSKPSGPPSNSNRTTQQSNQPRSQHQQNQQRPPPPNPPKSGFGSIFVDETQFPKWDD